jgi:hypothetical protein
VDFAGSVLLLAPACSHSIMYWLRSDKRLFRRKDLRATRYSNVLFMELENCEAKIKISGYNAIWSVPPSAPSLTPVPTFPVATQDCKIRSQPEDFWGRPGKVVPLWATYRVFGSTLQGLNQSIVGLSPLSETTYSTSHEIPNDGS